MNILILTRNANKNGNSIYNSYTRGITNNYPHALVLDYFDLYFEKGKQGFEATILEKIAQQSINVIFINFVSGDMTFELSFLEQLSQKCFMMMNFYDTELFFEPIDRYYAQCADIVLLPTASYFTYSYSLLGIPAISTLSLFDSALYEKKEVSKDIDISFVGDVSKKSRRDFVDYLRVQGYHVEVFGQGSPNGPVTFEKMVDIFNRSKINLNFSDTVEERTFNSNSNTNYALVPRIMQYMTQIKGRSIEVALCGGFVLSQYATGIEELFNADEMAVFKTKEALSEKVKYYLSHTKQREDMASKAHIKALTRYDSTKAFAHLFATLDVRQRNSKVIYTDKTFLSNYASHHALYFFNFLFKKKFASAMQELKIMLSQKLNFTTVINHCKQQFHYQMMRRR